MRRVRVLFSFDSLEALGEDLYLGSWDKGALHLRKGKWMTHEKVEVNEIAKIKYVDPYLYFFTLGNGVFREAKRAL